MGVLTVSVFLLQYHFVVDAIAGFAVALVLEIVFSYCESRSKKVDESSDRRSEFESPKSVRLKPGVVG